jgi:aerobic C4-dicarboxylate transport protein
VGNASTITAPRRPWYTILYVQVLIAIAVGILIGHSFPNTGFALKPARRRLHLADQDDDWAGDLLHGRARHRLHARPQEDRPRRHQDAVLLRGGIDAGAGPWTPGRRTPAAGQGVQHPTLDPNAVAGYVHRAQEGGIVAHLLAIIPETFIGAFAKGDLLQVLLVSILTGFAISHLGDLGERINDVIEAMAKIFFAMIRIIVRAAPIGAFGAMAFTVGAYGVASLVNLVDLIATFYLTSVLSSCSCSERLPVSPASRSCASSLTSKTNC